MESKRVLHADERQVWLGLRCAARWMLAVALLGLGVALSLVSQAGIPFLFIGLAILLGPWIARTARKDFHVTPRDGSATRRTTMRVAVALGVGVLAMVAGLAMLANSDDAIGAVIAVAGLCVTCGAVVVGIRRAW